MREIVLSNGGVARVDDEDFEALNRYRWRRTNAGYAVRNAWNKETRQYETVLMHRAILQPGVREQVDHMDGDRLNNQRGNLRHCTPSENQANRISLGGKSAHKGVSWSARNGCWTAEIKIAGNKRFLGKFESETEAAQAYRDAATQLRGEFILSRTTHRTSEKGGQK